MKIRMGPSGIHLFDRTTGTNLLIDEIAPPKTAWAIAPRQVSIALTNACDLACTFCFAPKVPATLNFDRVTAWLDELDSNGTIGVGFGGGEPTLYPRFVDLCTYATRNTGLAVTFTTHGHHLDDSMLTALNGNVHFVRVSMDGVRETYSRIRGRAFEVLLQRLEKIRTVVSFGINYVVNSDTLPDIDAAAEFAQALGASEFLLLPEQPTNEQGGISDAVAESLRDWVQNYTGSMRLAISERGAEGMPICNPFIRESGLRAYAHIDASGILKTTSYDSDGLDIGPEGIMSALAKLLCQTRIKS